MFQKLSTINSSTRFIKAGIVTGSVLCLIACGGDDSPVTDNSNPAQNSDNNSLSAAPGNASLTAIGSVLVAGAQNRTLYTFANDTDGSSNCNGGCATVWPPLQSDTAESNGDFSTITREDGSFQWAFKSQPLYYYEGDAGQGEINGEGINNVWFVARPDPFTSSETALGTVLTATGTTNAGQDDPAQRLDFNGRTLYVFDNDTANASNCNGGCASNWPPLQADNGAISSTDYTVITRDDGTTQWAYNTRPLYFFAGDNAAGDTTGEGVGGVWFAARP